jgi:putative ABC transport system permease protein
MLRHYLKLSFRNLERQKLSTLINILGLSIGVACFSLFVLYAVHEFNYDRFHAQAPNIYRVYDWWKFPGREGSEYSSATPIGPAMKNDLADVKDFVRFLGGGKPFVRVDGKLHSANVLFADPQVLSVFTFPLIAGDSRSALKDPNDIVLTRSTALQLFGDTEVVGRPLDIREDGRYQPFTVTAVVEDVPVNSTIRFDMLGNLERRLNTPMGKQSSNSWTMTIGISTYVLLHPGSTLMNEPERLAAFRRKYFPGEERDLKREGLWDGQGKSPSGFGLQRLAHVHTDVRNDPGAADPKKIWMLVGIAGASS